MAAVPPAQTRAGSVPRGLLKIRIFRVVAGAGINLALSFGVLPMGMKKPRCKLHRGLCQQVFICAQKNHRTVTGLVVNPILSHSTICISRRRDPPRRRQRVQAQTPYLSHLCECPEQSSSPPKRLLVEARNRNDGHLDASWLEFLLDILVKFLSPFLGNSSNKFMLKI